MQTHSFSFLESFRSVKQSKFIVALQALAFSPTTASEIKRSNHESRVQVANAELQYERSQEEYGVHTSEIIAMIFDALPRSTNI